MATAVIYPRSDQKGITSVKINIRHKYEKKQVHLFKVPDTQWDDNKLRVKSSHPDHARLNFELYTRLNTYLERIKNLNFKDHFTLADILDDQPELLSDAIDQYCQPLSPPNKRKYKNLKDKIIQYRDAYLSTIDLNYIKGFIHSLKQSDNINSQVTIHRYLNFLKTVLRSQSDHIDRSVLEYRIPKGSAQKAKLTHQEIMAIQDDDHRPLSRDAFLLCFYTYGSRIGDILQLREENIKNEYLEFTEQKTGKNKRIEIIPQIAIILNRYSKQSYHGYLLPILTRPWSDPKKDIKFNKHIQSKTAIINRDLKVIAASCGIKKKVTTHVARHSFASLADRANVNSRAIRDMMNFSSLNIMEHYLEDLRNTEYIKQQAHKVYKNTGS